MKGKNLVVSLKRITVLITFFDEKRSCLIADKKILKLFAYQFYYLLSIYIVNTFFSIYRSGDDYDNCLLSDEPFGSLNTAADLDYDLSWNVYRLSETNCVNDNYSEGKKNIT